MNPKQLDALFRGEVSATYKGAGKEDPKYFQKLYANKYRENGKLRKPWIDSIKYLTATHGEYPSSTAPILIPLDLELDIDGTGGIYPGNSFHSTYLPKRYQESTVFQMFDVNHRVDIGGWTTSITGKMRTTMGRIFEGYESLDEIYQKQFKQS